MTRDYDFWIAADDAELLDQAVRPFDMFPSRSPDEARRNGRYVLENDEHVDVRVARAVSTVDGVLVAFDEVWKRRTRFCSRTSRSRSRRPRIND